jgi:serine/threonine protein kinase/tetratricopeptide (TPR) repeat protein
MKAKTEAPDVSAEVLMGQVAEEFLDRLNRGERPEAESYVQRYPQLAGVLRQMLPALELMRAPAEGLSAPDEFSAAPPLLPGCLGDYRILREVGRGGMGVVYEAEQVSLGRRVALKVLPFASTLDSRQLQRFKNEAHAAAQLHHTHIVPVYATGCERGVHYYAMQYVEGQNLAALIGELRKLTGRDPAPQGHNAAPPSAPTRRVLPGDAASVHSQRSSPYRPQAAPTQAGEPTLGSVPPGLGEGVRQGPGFFRAVAQLGIQAAAALEHAHQLGVVHRDIKPGNLLVEGEAGLSTPGCRLWVTDFGLAHCRSQAGLTLTGDLVGTLRYMSPEQALARRGMVDHRTDIYSLGVTLYELLTLEPVFSGRDREELLRQIAFEEPRRPRRLNRAIPAELETIVLKALEKNLADRYATAQELADDLERFLKDEPIRARRSTLVLRARKWARRHRPMVWSAGVSFLVLLVLAVAGLTAGFIAVNEEQKRTQEALDEKELERQKAVASAARASLAAEAEQQARKRTQQALDEKELERQKAVASAAKASRAAEAERQARKLAQQRLGEIEKATEVLAAIFHDLDPRAEEKGGQPLSAQLGQRLDQAAAQLDGKAIGDPVAVAKLQLWLGPAQVGLGYPGKAIPLLCHAREVLTRELGPDDPLTLKSMFELGAAYYWAGQLDDAIRLIELTLEKMKSRLGPNHANTIATLNNLGDAYRQSGQFGKAISCHEQALEKATATLGAEHVNTLHTMSNLGLAYQAAGRLDKAIPLFEQAREKLAATFGPEHPNTLTSVNNLALGYQAAGRLDKAIPLFEQTLEKTKTKLGPDHPQTLLCMHNLASAYPLDKAIPLFEQALEKMKGRLGPDHANTLFCMNGLVSAYTRAGLLDKAIPLGEMTLAKRKVKLGPEHPETLTSMHNLALAYRAAGRHDRAIPLLEQAVAKQKVKLGPDHRNTLASMAYLADSYQMIGRLDQAIPLFEETLAKMKVKLGPGHPSTLSVMSALADACDQAGQFARSEPLYQAFLHEAKKRFGAADPRTLGQMVALGLNLLRQQKYADAEPLLRAAHTIQEKMEPDRWTMFNTQSMLGGCLLGQNKFAEAEPLLIAGYQGMKQRAHQIPPEGKGQLTEALQRLVRLYEALDNQGAAAKWRQQLEAHRDAQRREKK